MTDKLEPGWYWVKWEADDRWEVGEMTSVRWWGVGFSRPVKPPAIIGPRLTPPVDSGEGAANG